jgi:glycosyltransferase involved in cell wall biosynthesis
MPTARLRIVGFDLDGDPVLREEADRLGVLPSIEFVGSLTSEEVTPFYRAAKALVLPSAYEGLPMVLLEAMREGLPAVATDVSGHPDAIDDGVSGYLVPVDDVDAMADRCVILLRDSDATTEMRQRARQAVIERFSLDREVDAYMRLYGRLKAPTGG